MLVCLWIQQTFENAYYTTIIVLGASGTAVDKNSHPYGFSIYPGLTIAK